MGEYYMMGDTIIKSSVLTGELASSNLAVLPAKLVITYDNSFVVMNKFI